MPTYTRGVKRDILTYVEVGQAISVMYGFSTKNLSNIPTITAAHVAALGHINPNAVGPTAIKLFGANAPKPARFRKVIDGAAPTAAAQQSVSSFCGRDAYQTAEGAGWRLIKPARGVSIRRSGRSVTAVAELSNGALYAFPMNANDYATYSQVLGLIALSTLNSQNERDRLVSGSSRPKPGRAEKIVDGASVSSFFSTDSQGQLLAQEWSIISMENV